MLNTGDNLEEKAKRKLFRKKKKTTEKKRRGQKENPC